jgi:hypothetical protein
MKKVLFLPMRKRNDLALKAFERHFQEETGLVHFGVVAPIPENCFFALALLRKKEQKTMIEGKELLLRLTAYQSGGGFFPDAIHLMHHNGFSWKKNLLIAASLSLALEEFERIMDKHSKEHLQLSLKRVVEALFSVELPTELRFLLEIIDNKIPETIYEPNHFEAVVLIVIAHKMAKDLHLKKRIEGKIGEFVVEGYPAYQGPFEGLKQLKGFPLKSLLEISLTPEEDLKEEGAILDPVWMESVLGSTLDPLIGKAQSVRHRGKNEKTSIETRAFLELELGCTACLVLDHKATFDAKRSVYSIDLEGDYQEDAHEIGLYLTLDPSIAVFLNGSTSSVFRENELVEIVSKEKTILIKFRILGEGSFIGHISLDAKPYEIEKGGLYDRKISIRTVERPPVCKIELFIGWNGEECPF